MSDRLSEELTLVVEHTRAGLTSPDTALVPYGDLFAESFAMAGLAHCCVLLEELDRARLAENDLVAGLVGRAHLETWLTAAWLFLGGEDSHDTLKGSYRKEIRKNDEALQRSKERAEKAVKDARKRQAKVERVNAEIRARNQRTGDDRPLHDDVAIPPVVHIPADLLAGHRATAGPGAEADISFESMADQLGPMAVSGGIGGGNWEIVYNLGYRSLSSFAAHPSYWLLHQYFEPTSWFNRIRTHVPSDGRARGVTRVAVGLTAMLAAEVLAPRGIDVSPFRELDSKYRSEFAGGDSGNEASSSREPGGADA
jgi:hypothetical protein